MILNGFYTITNKDGEHRTFRIRTQPDDAKFAPGERIIGLLNGPDNGRDYEQFGFVKDDRVTVWTKKRGQGKMSAFDWYAFLIRKGSEALVGEDGVQAAADFTAGGREYCIQAARHCVRCNRLLTTPESVRRGCGDECAKKMGLAA